MDARQFVNELVEAWNSHDIERVVSFYAPDYEGIDVAEPEVQRGQDAIRRMAERNLQGFPDAHMVVEDVLAEGNRVVFVWLSSGTHAGRLMNIPPTHRVVKSRGVSILTIENGKVVRSLRFWDIAAMLRQIRLLPELTA
jgi:steroid delta-isomerase-like uncharacterized protein